MGQDLAGRWRDLAEEVWLGVAEWRAAHPKATFTEIEQVVEDRLAVIRTRLLTDLALASAASDIAAVGEEDRPRCPECAGGLEPRGRQVRELTTLRGAVVQLKRSYAVCRSCGAGDFPPR
jgi:hypothetical protein